MDECGHGLSNQSGHREGGGLSVHGSSQSGHGVAGGGGHHGRQQNGHGGHGGGQIGLRGAEIGQGTGQVTCTYRSTGCTWRGASEQHLKVS